MWKTIKAKVKEMWGPTRKELLAAVDQHFQKQDERREHVLRAIAELRKSFPNQTPEEYQAGKKERLTRAMEQHKARMAQKYATGPS
ncbi:MAG: hypothetical protein FWF24_05960 [Alphaproteobacteria bacterium]|nr:hypothetical protein [Alphaproteobacteria bacterium]